MLVAPAALSPSDRALSHAVPCDGACATRSLEAAW